MSNVTAIPEGKGTPQDKREHEAFVNGEENLRHAGITPLKGDGYDPEAGNAKAKTARPEPTYGPLLTTDPGQPEDIEAKGVRRSSDAPLDNRQGSRVDSSQTTGTAPTGRKAGNARAEKSA